MAAPSIVGEPSIVQKGPSVVCECLVNSGTEPTVKWFRDDKEFQEGSDYKFSITKPEDKFKIQCAILVRSNLCLLFPSTFW